MAYDFTSLEESITATNEWLKSELLNIQTGRATPTVLDGIKVEAYGASVPLQQVATITTSDARSLRLVPYNADDITMIERAIADADLGVSVSSDDKGVRVSFPELTTETREKYVKMVGKKREEARVSLRNERDEVWAVIQKLEKDGEIGKDEKFQLKEKMEKMVKQANEELDALASRKEKDIMG